MTASAIFHEVSANRADEFLAKGYPRRRFFPHRIYHLPKCGPDAFRLAEWSLGERDPAHHWEIVLYATGPLIDEFPREVFFDDDVVWHQQQFGKPGQVATANLVLDGDTLHSTVHVSDLVQRISRRRDLKTRVEKRFDGWAHMLVNAILHFALERGVKAVHTATADLAMKHTDPRRKVGRELYERIYDGVVQPLDPVRHDKGWWTIAVDESRVVVPERRTEPIPAERTFCICHDIERGVAHAQYDPPFAASVDAASPRNLEEMLAIESDLGCRTTYNVLGLLHDEVRDGIEAADHAVAFHSYDHRIEKPQLRACREIDYRLKGYRPPQSNITPELTDANLCFHNFEWLASSCDSLGLEQPRMTGGLVKLPIVMDDFALYSEGLEYERWEELLLEKVEGRAFAAVGLHDCYAPFWLPHYRGLLERLEGLGRLATMNEVAAEVTLANAA